MPPRLEIILFVVAVLLIAFSGIGTLDMTAPDQKVTPAHLK